MKTILVLAEHPEFPERVGAALDPSVYRVVHRARLEDAEPLLNEHLVDFCLLDADLTQVQEIWVIERLRHRLPRCPIVVFTKAAQSEWVEEAYLLGVQHVLAKPVRPRLLLNILERLAPGTAVAEPPLPPAPPPPPPAAPAWFAPRETPLQAFETLSALRDFSAVLGESLCAEALLRQFLLLLREVLGVNRSAVFLRPPARAVAQSQPPPDPRQLRSVCAVGLVQTLVEAFHLSYDSGIGSYLHRHGRILRYDSADALRDPAIRREFGYLGVQVAVPIFDREALIGVAVLDGRVTGEPLSNPELSLVFHLLEALGLAIKNIWLHDQLADNHEILSDVLRQFSSGCLVVGQDLSILHANRAVRALFPLSGRRGGDLDFNDLPQDLGSRIYQVLRTGTAVAPFRYQPELPNKPVYQVSIVPIQGRNAALPSSALAIVEDHTQSEQLRRLEIEAANLRLVGQMADRLAHEVGNAMVPLSTHQQLFAKKYGDPEFRSSLDTALTEGVRRVTRLVNQMRFLARTEPGARDVFPLAPLVEEAYQEAQKYQPIKSAQLKYSVGDKPVIVCGDRASIKHAMAEILLNALQANPTNARIAVDMEVEKNGADQGWVRILFRDNGGGFTAEALTRVPEPFFTTRNVGLGLGLVVSRKVAENHRGKLEIVAANSEKAGLVRLSLPLAPAPENGS